MGQVLHGSIRTTEAIRRAIQHRQESLRALAKRYGINPKTVAGSHSAHRQWHAFHRAHPQWLDASRDQGEARPQAAVPCPLF